MPASPTDHVPLELQGFFPDNASLQDALDRLEAAGFSRGDLSPPEEHPNFGEKPAGDPGVTKASDTDKAQLRTLGTGMAGYAAAAAVAGATIATGGAAVVAVAAAAVVGVGSAAAAGGVGRAADQKADEQRDDLALEGRLVLGVRTSTVDEATIATDIMTGAGAVRVRPIDQVSDATTAGLSSALWTG